MGPTPSLSGQTPLANWRRRILILVAGAVVIGGGFFGGKWWWAEWTARQAEAELHAAIAGVAAVEPNGWQLEDLERQREKIPDDQNSFDPDPGVREPAACRTARVLAGLEPRHLG